MTTFPSEPVWTLEQALAFVRELDSFVRSAGYSVGLAGSVLLQGTSRKDLDLIMFPLSKARQDQNALKDVLFARGLLLKRTGYELQRGWALVNGREDSKHVEEWSYQGKRIDVFFLS